MTSTATVDVIDTLVGITEGDPLDQLRRKRPAAKENAQESYTALFHPVDASAVSPAERQAIAAFVAGLHGSSAAQQHYAAQLTAHADSSFVDAIVDELVRAATTGPYGSYKEPDLQTENTDGLRYTVEAGNAEYLGSRLSSALEHAHLLIFHPRDARPEHVQGLLDAGWNTDGIVTISQLVAFLSFQVRVVHGLTEFSAVLTKGN